MERHRQMKLLGQKEKSLPLRTKGLTTLCIKISGNIIMSQILHWSEIMASLFVLKPYLGRTMCQQIIYIH